MSATRLDSPYTGTGSLLHDAGRRRRFINSLGFVVVLVTTTVAIVYPFYWMVMASFMPLGYSLGNETPLLLPKQFSIDPWLAIFRERPLLLWLGNTTIINVTATFVVIPVSLLASYSLNRYRFRGRMPFIVFVLLGQLLPASALIVPLFLMFRDAGLLNTTGGVVIAYITFMLPTAIWVLWGYMQGIPLYFEEAALVDGCNRFQAFRLVTLPLAMPGLAATSLFIFLDGWNHYLLAFVLAGSTDQWVISLGLFAFIGAYHTEIEQMMATSVVAAAPALAVFALLQRHLRGGLALGGVKG